MKILFSLIFVIAAMFSGLAFAADVADPSFWDGILAKIPEMSPTLLLFVGGALDLVLRWTKTEKPLSVLRLIAVVLAGVAKVADKLAKGLDLILGQRAAKPADPVVK